MKRFFILEDDFLQKVSEIVVTLEQGEIGAFALEIALLLKGLSQSLSICPNKDVSLVLSLIERSQVSKAVVMHNPGDNTIGFTLGRNQLECLYTTLLTVIRWLQLTTYTLKEKEIWATLILL